MLSNTDIDHMFWNPMSQKSRAPYAGCFLQDELPEKPEQGKLYILNLGKHDDPNDDGSLGTHWCLCANMLIGTICYFDPFGQPPSERILAWMKKAKTGGKFPGREKRLIYSTLQLQDINSDSCGYFCCYVAQELMKSRPFLDILLDDFNIFEKWMNDKLVQRIHRKKYVDEL